MNRTCQTWIVLVGLLALGFGAGMRAGYLLQAAQDHSHAAISHAQPRSPHWPTVRKHFLEAHPVCEVCRTTKDLEAHHVKPFHVHPELELDPANLITLCREHHRLFGHLDSWQSWNVDVRQDAATWRKKIQNRPTE